MAHCIYRPFCPEPSCPCPLADHYLLDEGVKKELLKELRKVEEGLHPCRCAIPRGIVVCGDCLGVIT